MRLCRWWTPLVAALGVSGCDSSPVPAAPATLRIALEAGLPAGAKFTVQVGDSSVSVGSGESSRCLRWPALAGTHQTAWTFVVGDSTFRGQYTWKVQEPTVDLYVWEQQGWISFSWVDSPCGNKLLAIPATHRVGTTPSSPAAPPPASRARPAPPHGPT
jgi:hypothetical protein